MLYLTIAINLMIWFTWKAPASTNQWYTTEYTFSWYKPLFYALAGAHIFFSTMLFFSFFLSHPPSLGAMFEQMFGLKYKDMLASSPYRKKRNREKIIAAGGTPPQESETVKTGILGFFGLSIEGILHWFFPNLWARKAYGSR